MIDVIRFAAPDRFQGQSFIVSGDSLTLLDLCIDCFSHLFPRS